MTDEERVFPPDRAALRRCPVCEAQTIGTVARLRLYLGATERCSECMAGWKFSWSRWLYHVPIALTFALVVGAAMFLDLALDDAVVLVSVVLAALVAPMLLPIEARIGDRLTNNAIRRQERREEEEDAGRRE